jgi:hypothetical protein
MPKSVMPSIKETAFDCPHCGAYTTQRWYHLYTQGLSDDHRIPTVIDEQFLENVRLANIPAEAKETALKRFQKSRSGLLILSEKADSCYAYSVDNLYLSQCFNCKEFSVWIYDRLVFPTLRDRRQIPIFQKASVGTMKKLEKS